MSILNRFVITNDNELNTLLDSKNLIEEIIFSKRAVGKNVVIGRPLTNLIKKYAMRPSNLNFIIASVDKFPKNCVLYPYNKNNDDEWNNFVELDEEGNPMVISHTIYNAVLSLVEDITEMPIEEFTDGYFSYIEINNAS